MSKKIIFMGTPLFSVPILKSLYQNGYPISVVYSQPPQKSNRGYKINKSSIQNIAETLNIEFRSPHALKNKIMNEDEIKKINEEISIEMDEAMDFAINSPLNNQKEISVLTFFQLYL